MTRDELLAKLIALQTGEGYESEHIKGFIRRAELHIDADQSLLDYINDPEISAAFHGIEKWYS
jgi:hypothetical protein